MLHPRPRDLRPRPLLLALLLILAGFGAACAGGGDAARNDGQATAAEQGGADRAEGQAGTPGEQAAGDGAQIEAQPAPEAEAELEPPASVAEEIALPSGFAAFRWWEGLSEPTALAFAPDGRLFVTELNGRIWALRDTDGNGVADEQVLFSGNYRFAGLHGIAIASDGRVFLSDRGRILLAEDLDGDGEADSLRTVLADLPVGRQQNNGILLGPQGHLFITLGATCNDCDEASPLSGSLLVIDPAGGLFQTVATGLHNPLDLALTPDGTLWATEQSPTAPCQRSDELNRIEDGAHYGWPYCSPGAGAGETPVATFEPGAHAGGLVWLESFLFPDTLSGGFYVTLGGAPGTARDVGRRVVFVQRQDDGRYEVRDFATGFERPIAIRVGPTTQLYVADRGRGVIYRIGPPPE